MDKVLQSRDIYTSVSHGNFASDKSVLQAFPDFKIKNKLDKQKFLQFALVNGEEQEGDKERKAKNDHLLGDIVEYINEHIIDTNTKTPVSHEMVRNLLKQVNFRVMPNKNVKASSL